MRLLMKRQARRTRQRGSGPRWPVHGLASRRGAAGAEFAVVLPIMALILAGLFSAWGYFYAYLATLTAANDCAVMVSQADVVVANMAVQHDRQAYGQPFNGSVVDFGSASTTTDACLVQNHATFTFASQAIYAYFTYPLQRYSSDWSGHPARPVPSTWP
jgi:Flp pilus assembly protein TadG